MSEKDWAAITDAAQKSQFPVWKKVRYMTYNFENRQLEIELYTGEVIKYDDATPQQILDLYGDRD